MAKGIRAFSDPKYDYYELQHDLCGVVPKGAIFVHDKDDTANGSIAEGCLKLCWTPDGNVYMGSQTGVGGGSVIFHAAFIETDMFRPCRTKEELENDIANGVENMRSLLDKMNSLFEQINDVLR